MINVKIANLKNVFFICFVIILDFDDSGRVPYLHDDWD